MIQAIPIKTGATFSVAMLVLLPAGAWTADADIRASDDSLIAVLTVSLSALGTPDSSGNTHSGLLEATAAQTATWPIGSWRCDVRFTDASPVPVVVQSDSFVVTVGKGVTHD